MREFDNFESLAKKVKLLENQIKYFEMCKLNQDWDNLNLASINNDNNDDSEEKNEYADIKESKSLLLPSNAYYDDKNSYCNYTPFELEMLSFYRCSYHRNFNADVINKKIEELYNEFTELNVEGYRFDNSEVKRLILPLVWGDFCVNKIDHFLSYINAEYEMRLYFWCDIMSVIPDKLVSAVKPYFPILAPFRILRAIRDRNNILSSNEIMVLISIYMENAIIDLSFSRKELAINMIRNYINSQLEIDLQTFSIYNRNKILEVINNTIECNPNWKIIKKYLYRTYRKIYLKGPILKRDVCHGVRGIDYKSIIDCEINHIGWECILFYNGFYRIYLNASHVGNYYTVQDDYSRTGLNHIRSLFCEKCPSIKISMKDKQIVSVSNIKPLRELVALFEHKSTSVKLSPKSNKTPHREVVSDKDKTNSSLNKVNKTEAKKIIKELKSKYLDFLCSYHLDNYKVVCCHELRINSYGQHIHEYSFIFTIKETRYFTFLAYENTWDDRSTYIFPVRRSSWEESVDIIHSYFSSSNRNKRQSLASGQWELPLPGNGGMIRAYHTDYMKWRYKITNCESL